MQSRSAETRTLRARKYSDEGTKSVAERRRRIRHSYAKMAGNIGTRTKITFYRSETALILQTPPPLQSYINAGTAPAPATGLHNVHIRIMENRLPPEWGVLRSKCLATKYQLYSCLFVVRLIKDKAEFFRDCVKLLLRRDIKFLKNERVNLIIVNFLLLIMRDEVGKIYDTAQHF